MSHSLYWHKIQDDKAAQLLKACVLFPIRKMLQCRAAQSPVPHVCRGSIPHHDIWAVVPSLFPSLLSACLNKGGKKLNMKETIMVCSRLETENSSNIKFLVNINGTFFKMVKFRWATHEEFLKTELKGKWELSLPRVLTNVRSQIWGHLKCTHFIFTTVKY